jgi:hypothetical protein
MPFFFFRGWQCLPWIERGRTSRSRSWPKPSLCIHASHVNPAQAQFLFVYQLIPDPTFPSHSSSSFPHSLLDAHTLRSISRKKHLTKTSSSDQNNVDFPTLLPIPTRISFQEYPKGPSSCDGIPELCGFQSDPLPRGSHGHL